MNKILKNISISLVILLTSNLCIQPVLYARESGITAPVLDVPESTIDVPDDMPSPYENLNDKYTNSKEDLKEQGWGENNYEDGLANKLTPPAGFGQQTGQDVFMGTYGTSVMNENWADFGHSLYTEEKFKSQQTIVAKSYVNYAASYTPYVTASAVKAAGNAKPTGYGTTAAGTSASAHASNVSAGVAKNKQEQLENLSTANNYKDNNWGDLFFGNDKATTMTSTLGCAAAGAAIGTCIGGPPIGTLVGGLIGAGFGLIGGLISDATTPDGFFDNETAKVGNEGTFSGGGGSDDVVAAGGGSR